MKSACTFRACVHSGIKKSHRAPSLNDTLLMTQSLDCKFILTIENLLLSLYPTNFKHE